MTNVEWLAGREVPLGGVRAMTVIRSLPSQDRRTVGPWCFVDHFGPDVLLMDVPPHPHTGLQTVTWLVEGEVHHLDSVGSDAIIRPGQLNLMTSGHGIAHSEQPVSALPARLHGVQLWVALPEQSRDQAPHFERHTDLPNLFESDAQITVLMGTYGEATSPAATYSPIVGLAVSLAAGGAAPLVLQPDFEHAVLLLSGAAAVDGEPLRIGALLYLATGRTVVALAATAATQLVVIGGVPFEEELVMWWNFVGRSNADIATSRADWVAEQRFGVVTGYPGKRLPAPDLPSVPLIPRLRMRPPRRR